MTPQHAVRCQGTGLPGTPAACSAAAAHPRAEEGLAGSTGIRIVYQHQSGWCTEPDGALCVQQQYLWCFCSRAIQHCCQLPFRCLLTGSHSRMLPHPRRTQSFWRCQMLLERGAGASHMWCRRPRYHSWCAAVLLVSSCTPGSSTVGSLMQALSKRASGQLAPGTGAGECPAQACSC